MPYEVFLTADAAVDLEDLHGYIPAQDGPARAAHVLERIEAVFESLTDNPHRGVWPAELLEIGLREYREVFFKPYRIIYRVIDTSVFVMLVADGRRDMQTLLQRRLVQA